MNYTNIVERVDVSVKQKYMYQELPPNRTTQIYEQAETSRPERQSISGFINGLDEGDEWLKTYLSKYYLSPYEDGQTDKEYLIHRCNAGIGTAELKRSWQHIEHKSNWKQSLTDKVGQGKWRK